MASQSLDRVTVYKLNGITKPSDLKLKNYSLVLNKKKTVGGTKFEYWLHFLNAGPKEPTWFRAFQNLPLNLGAGGPPQVQLPGFVLLVKSGGDFYAMTGGLGHVALRAENEIEASFGTILAEKILAVPELRGLIQKDTGGNVLRLDRVFRGRYNPTLDIDNLRRILSTVRGSLDKKNKAYATIGKSITAGDALSVNGAKSFDGLFKFVSEVASLWASPNKSCSIPRLQRIDKKAQPTLVADLDAALIESLANYTPGGAESLYVDGDDCQYLPDVVTTFQLVRGTNAEPEVSTQEELLACAAAVLKPLPAAARAAAYASLKVRVVCDDETDETRPLSHCVCGDVTHNGGAYFLDRRSWYRADPAFLALVDQELDNITCLPPSTLNLLKWDRTVYATEGEFNTDCCAKGNMMLLDCKTVRFPGEKGPVEFCDIFAEQNAVHNLIHVKRAAGASLRELFAQGFVSADLYRSSDFQDLVHTATLTNHHALSAKEKATLAALKGRRRQDFRIVYAIFDDTHAMPAGATLTSQVFHGTLTPFAKVDLLDRVQRLRTMGYKDIVVTRIAG